MNVRRLLLVPVLAAAGIAQAQVPEASLGGTLVRLPLAPNHCRLDENNPSDQRVLQATRTAIPPSNRLLLLSTNCGELADWRSGKRKLLGDLVQYQTVGDGRFPAAKPGETVRQACAEMRRQGDAAASSATAPANERLKEAAFSVKLNEMKFLGVIGEDPGACFGAALVKFRSEFGNDLTRVNAFSLSEVRERMVFHYIASEYAGDRTVSDLLVRLRAGVAALRKANN